MCLLFYGSRPSDGKALSRFVCVFCFCKSSLQLSTEYLSNCFPNPCQGVIRASGKHIMLIQPCDLRNLRSTMSSWNQRALAFMWSYWGIGLRTFWPWNLMWCLMRKLVWCMLLAGQQVKGPELACPFLSQWKKQQQLERWSASSYRAGKHAEWLPAWRNRAVCLFCQVLTPRASALQMDTWESEEGVLQGRPLCRRRAGVTC